MTNEDNKKEVGKSAGLAELDGHKFVLGSPHQSDVYLKTHKLLVTVLGKHFDKNLKLLVQKEVEPTFPPPADLPSTATETEKEMQRAEIKLLLEDKRRYQRGKSQLFSIIMDMCANAMRNKLEGLATYDTLEANDDVVGLLGKIKELVYSTDNTQYKYWVMQKQVAKLHCMQMDQKESIEEFGSRFLDQLKVAEDSWGGKFIPREAHGKSTEIQDATRNKYMACLFLGRVDRGRFKKALDDLNNDFLLGNVSYPEDIAGVIKLLTNRKGEGGGNRINDAIKDGVVLTQVQKGPKCFNCRQRGHYARNCPEPPRKKDSDGGDDKSQSSTGTKSARKNWNRKPGQSATELHWGM